MNLLLALLLSIGPVAEPTPPLHSVDCARVAGFEEVAGEAMFIVMGERHGTVQSPRLFGEIVCHASQRRPVNVLLEYRTKATSLIQAYVDSDGSAQARAALLDHDIWDPRFADGRNSKAMLDLLETLRLLKRAGADLRVYATQPDYLTRRHQFYGELARASDWANIAAERPQARNLILAGRAHAALLDNDDLGFLPAAAHLRPGDVVALGPADEGGASWRMYVSPDGKPLMGVHPIDGKPRTSAGITMGSDASSGWTARYAFGEVAEPSLPARR